jgi:hypothetical protein
MNLSTFLGTNTRRTHATAGPVTAPTRSSPIDLRQLQSPRTDAFPVTAATCTGSAPIQSRVSWLLDLAAAPATPPLHRRPDSRGAHHPGAKCFLLQDRDQVRRRAGPPPRELGRQDHRHDVQQAVNPHPRLDRGRPWSSRRPRDVPGEG